MDESALAQLMMGEYGAAMTDQERQIMMQQQMGNRNQTGGAINEQERQMMMRGMNPTQQFEGYRGPPQQFEEMQNQNGATMTQQEAEYFNRRFGGF